MPSFKPELPGNSWRDRHLQDLDRLVSKRQLESDLARANFRENRDSKTLIKQIVQTLGWPFTDYKIGLPTKRQEIPLGTDEEA